MLDKIPCDEGRDTPRIPPNSERKATVDKRHLLRCVLAPLWRFGRAGRSLSTRCARGPDKRGWKWLVPEDARCQDGLLIGIKSNHPISLPVIACCFFRHKLIDAQLSITKQAHVDTNKVCKLFIALVNFPCSSPQARGDAHGGEDAVIVEEQPFKCLFDE